MDIYDILGFVLINTHIYIYIRKWGKWMEVKKEKYKINERNGRDAID